MHSEDDFGDDGISIAVGDGISRRRVLKQVGAAGAVLGMSGCTGDDDPVTAEPIATTERTPTDPETPDTPTTDPTTTGPPTTDPPTTDPPTSTASGDAIASRHPAVAPPAWDPGKTESGDGLNERRAVFVIQNVDNPFFIPIVCGFHDALHQFGWTGQVRGPSQAGSLQDQVNIIETEAGNMSEGDVIVTTILDDQTYNDAIRSALDAGIVVVNGHTTPTRRDWNYDVMRGNFTYTSPVTGEDREMVVPHVGIRDAHGGAAMAAEMHDRLRARFPDQDEYTVFLVNDLPDNPMITRRVDEAAADEGTAQRYFEAQEDVGIYQDQVFTTPQPPEVDVSRNFVVDTIRSEGVDAVVGSAFWAAVGAGTASSAGELDEDMLVCGFDLAGMVGTGTSSGPIANGHVDFVVGQDPYNQGYQSASMAWTYLERGMPMKNLEWGVSVWDENNVEFATQRRSWGDLVDWQKNNYDGLTE